MQNMINKNLCTTWNSFLSGTRDLLVVPMNQINGHWKNTEINVTPSKRTFLLFTWLVWERFMKQLWYSIYILVSSIMQRRECKMNAYMRFKYKISNYTYITHHSQLYLAFCSHITVRRKNYVRHVVTTNYVELQIMCLKVFHFYIAIFTTANHESLFIYLNFN